MRPSEHVDGVDLQEAEPVDDTLKMPEIAGAIGPLAAEPLSRQCDAPRRGRRNSLTLHGAASNACTPVYRVRPASPTASWRRLSTGRASGASHASTRDSTGGQRRSAGGVYGGSGMGGQVMNIHRGRLIDHLHLKVNDLDASKRFYKAALAALEIPLVEGTVTSLPMSCGSMSVPRSLTCTSPSRRRTAPWSIASMQRFLRPAGGTTARQGAALPSGLLRGFCA